jgi:phospholipid-translocating ATPase
VINLNQPPTTIFPNVIKNQKYNILTIIPIVLFNQFKFFSNQFFLLLCVTQFIDPLKVGFLFSYVAPLACVLAITFLKEAYDDFNRYNRDKEANNAKYK